MSLKKTNIIFQIFLFASSTSLFSLTDTIKVENKSGQDIIFLADKITGATDKVTGAIPIKIIKGETKKIQTYSGGNRAAYWAYEPKNQKSYDIKYIDFYATSQNENPATLVIKDEGDYIVRFSYSWSDNDYHARKTNLATILKQMYQAESQDPRPEWAKGEKPLKPVPLRPVNDQQKRPLALPEPPKKPAPQLPIKIEKKSESTIKQEAAAANLTEKKPLKKPEEQIKKPLKKTAEQIKEPKKQEPVKPKPIKPETVKPEQVKPVISWPKPYQPNQQDQIKKPKEEPGILSSIANAIDSAGKSLKSSGEIIDSMEPITRIILKKSEDLKKQAIILSSKKSLTDKLDLMIKMAKTSEELTPAIYNIIEPVCDLISMTGRDIISLFDKTKGKTLMNVSDMIESLKYKSSQNFTSKSGTQITKKPTDLSIGEYANMIINILIDAKKTLEKINIGE